MFEFKLNVKKTENLTTDVNKSSCVLIKDADLARTSVSRNLGSAKAYRGGGELMRECSKVQAPFVNWTALRQEGARALEAEDLKTVV